jgi:transposase InsO family protein
MGSVSCRPESGGVTSRSVTNAPFPAIGCRWIRARSGLASTSLQAIDDCSRFVVAGLARRRSADAAVAFLDQVLEEMPFSIQRVQTDRGAEFFAEEVQRRLMGEAIRFRPIPPRSPQLNGKVERAQRTILEEFWAMADPKAADVGEQLALWVHHYNWHRSHESLHGDTPVDRVCQRADKTPLWVAVCEAYDPAKERIQVRHHAIDIALRALK